MSPATTHAASPSKETSSIRPSPAAAANSSPAQPAGAASHRAKCFGVAGPYAYR